MHIAGRLGLEPRYTPPEGVVLPLDDLPAISTKDVKEHFCTFERTPEGSFAYH